MERTNPNAVDPARLGKTLQFMRLLWALSHALASLSKRMESELGVTGPQRLALRILGRVPGLSARDLAGTLHLHPSTLTGVLRRLEARGFVRREADPDDARRAKLTLTATGKALNDQRARTVEGAVRRALTRASPESLKAATELLTLIVAEIEREAGD